jgi:hypothetical protein
MLHGGVEMDARRVAAADYLATAQQLLSRYGLVTRDIAAAEGIAGGFSAVYAVLKAVSGSSDGRDKGLTAPRPEGQALAWRGGQAIGSRSAQNPEFPTRDDIGLRRWRQFSERLRQDPSAVFYYDFEQDPSAPDRNSPTCRSMGRNSAARGSSAVAPQSSAGAACPGPARGPALSRARGSGSCGSATSGFY